MSAKQRASGGANAPATRTTAVVEIGLLAVLYFVTARLGQLLAIPPGNITPIWIPSGIMLAAVLWRGYRVWPGIIIGAFAGNIWAYFDHASTDAMLRCLLAATVNGLGDTLGAVVTAYLILRTTGGREFLARPGDAMKFIGFGALLGAGMSAVLGVTALRLTGFIPAPKYFNALGIWWVGDGIGVLVVTPALLVWRGGWRGCRFGGEELVFAVLLPGATVVGLALVPAVPGLLILPLLLWAVFRFDRRVTFTALAGEALLVSGLTMLGSGPFAAGQARHGLMPLPLFLTLMAVPVVMIAGALAESARLRERLRESEQARRPTAAVAAPGVAELQLPLRSVAVGILLVELIATGVAAYYARPVATVAARQAFDFDCREIQDRVANQLAACEQVLQSGVALFGQRPVVSRQEWRQFVEGQNLARRLNGVQAVEFVPVIPRAQLAQHIQAVRAEGFPDYAVYPAGDGEFCCPVTYVEPFTELNRRAFGYDLWSEPVRRAALERARDFGGATLTEPIRLVQETTDDAQVGVLMFVPVYRAGLPTATVDQRRAALQGWVCSPYRLSDLMHGILGNWDLQTDRRIRLRVLDGAILLDDSQSDALPAGGLSVQSRLPVAGRQWTLEFTRTGGAGHRVELVKVWVVLFGGVSGSVLLSWLMLNLFTTRLKARQAAQQLAADLDQMKNIVHESQQIAHLGSWEYMVATQTTRWSEEQLRIYGLNPAGSSPNYQIMLRDCIHPDDAARLDATFRQCLQDRAVFAMEHRLVRPDGSVRVVQETARPYFDDHGSLVKYVGATLDITERKQAEERQAQANAELLRFNRAAVGRELRLIEMKQEVNALAAQLGQPRPYPLTFLEPAAPPSENPQEQAP